MTTRERAYARANNQRAAQYTELWIVGTRRDIDAMTAMAARNGLLVYASAITHMGGDDIRVRRYLRLRTR